MDRQSEKKGLGVGSGMKALETATERWAQWKARNAQAESTPRSRILTIPEKRRLAQTASVISRRQNKALRRQGERDLARAARELERQRNERLDEFLDGNRQPNRAATTLTEEDCEKRDLQLGRRWREFEAHHRIPKLHTSPPLFVNLDALALVERALGQEPFWVRARRGYREHTRLTFHPLDSWWADPEWFILAMRVEDYEFAYGWPKPYQHKVQVYWLKPHDLLEHHERGAYEMAAEAVPWASVLAAPSIIRLHELPVPPLRSVARAIKRYWRGGGQRQVPMPAVAMAA